MKTVKISNNFIKICLFILMISSCKKTKSIPLYQINNQKKNVIFDLEDLNYARYKESETVFITKDVVIKVELSKIYYKNNGKHELYISDNNTFSKGFIIPFNFQNVAPESIIISDKYGFNNKKIENGFVVTFNFSRISADYVFIYKNKKYFLMEINKYCESPRDIYGNKTDTLFVYSTKIFNQNIDELSKKQIDEFICSDWSKIKCNYIIIKK